MFITLSFYWALYVLAYVIAEVSYKVSTSTLDWDAHFTFTFACVHIAHLWGGRVVILTCSRTPDSRSRIYMCIKAELLYM